MNSKLIGGILLVTGTTIGAGMLALPVATAQLGFVGSLILLIVGWAIMLVSAFLFLEVNLRLPSNTNLISMVGVTLGKGGQAIAWVVYLLFMYSILSAYTAGGGDLFHYVLSNSGVTISPSMSAALFTFLFGLIVCFGIRAVDYANRGLMFGKMGSYLMLVILVLPFVSTGLLMDGEFKHIFSPTSLTVTSLAFSNLIIIPSLRTYFNDDITSLKKAIFIGTTIPLICYIAWDLVILGVVPLHGASGFNEIVNSSNSNSALLSALMHFLQQDNILVIAKFFTSICMATSFLSVALSLSDFLADGLRTQKQGLRGMLINSMTLLPPVIIVIYYPDTFMRALNFGGIFCLILMVMFPALMAWRGRYYEHLLVQKNTLVQVGGGKMLLVFLMTFATLLIGYGLHSTI
jgi:tyrosine-specific transport protein